MSAVEIEKDDAVAVIKMTNGENRDNKIFQESMSNSLDEVAGVKGLQRQS